MVVAAEHQEKQSARETAGSVVLAGSVGNGDAEDITDTAVKDGGCKHCSYGEKRTRPGPCTLTS